MFLHPWKCMVLAQQDEREALIVAEQHIVRRPEALDQLILVEAIGGSWLVGTVGFAHSMRFKSNSPSLRGAEGDAAIQLDCFVALAMTAYAAALAGALRLIGEHPLDRGAGVDFGRIVDR